ncbi:LOW QUALITY PROTEIN: dynactin-associated protein-like [Erethizon dorsatum]
MDRKHGKYTVNVECSGNQLPSACPHDQEAHTSTCWCPPPNDITSDVSSTLSGVWVSPGILAQSRCPQAELSYTQMKGKLCSDRSLWKVFLACLLACVVTIAFGILILCLVNNKGNNPTIVIQQPTNNGEPAAASTTSQSTATTTSSQTTRAATSTGATPTAVSTGTTATASAIASAPPVTTTPGTSRDSTVATSATGPTTPAASGRAVLPAV